MPVASASTARPLALESLRRLTPPAAAFLAGGAPVVLLGFSRGGYPVEVIAGYGVALWWLLLVGFLTDAIPRPRPTRAGWVVLAAAVGLAAWGGLSLSWTADRERGLTEVVRLVVALGSLLLGMSAARAGQSRALAGGVFAGLTAVVTAAVLTRLFPDLVASATETGQFLQATRRRLAWPLNYWNGVAAAAAMAIPLGLVLAARGRNVWASAAAAAPIPVLAIGIGFTLSRGGIAAAALGVAAAVILIAPRPVLMRTAVAPAIGTVAALIAGLGSPSLTNVVGGASQADAGRKVFVVLLVATAGVALAQAGLRTADQAHWTPQIRRPGPRVSVGTAGVAFLVCVVVFVAAGGPGRLSDGWDRFRDKNIPTAVSTGNTADRLSSVSGNGRYQMWSGALDALDGDKLKGIGLGSWESWWNPRRDGTGFVRNAHSEVFELLAETGLVGGGLFLAMLLVPLGAGATAAFRRSQASRDRALAVPALVAFTLALLIDWNWQLGAIMVAGTTLAAVPLSRTADEGAAEPRSDGHARRFAAAIGVAAVSLAAIAVLAIALVAPQSVQASRDAAGHGDAAAAAREAARGETAVGFAASPALQLAVVEEQAGHLASAEAAARRAASRTPDDWRPWFLVARIAAARGHDDAAIDAFRKARRLNPDSQILKP